MFLTKAGSLEVEVVMGRQILGMLLTMYLPTTLMNIIGRFNNTYLVINHSVYSRTCNKLYEEILF